MLVDTTQNESAQSRRQDPFSPLYSQMVYQPPHDRILAIHKNLKANQRDIGQAAVAHLGKHSLHWRQESTMTKCSLCTQGQYPVGTATAAKRFPTTQCAVCPGGVAFVCEDCVGRGESLSGLSLCHLCIRPLLDVRCLCPDKPKAILRASKWAGSNKGRMQYACPRSDIWKAPEKCKFTRWEDQPIVLPTCECKDGEQVCGIFESRTELRSGTWGKKRRFCRCTNAKDSQCSVFVWMDD